MLNRGYPTDRFVLPISPPTPLQIASYSALVVEAAKRNPEKLRALLQAGLSPNCCNSHGDALLNMVCRRGLEKSLWVLIDCGTRLDVSAGDGLTPLHEACWHSPPNFAVVDTILRHSGYNIFHIRDKKGFVPLQYTNIDDWDAWLRYLESRKDLYWPLEGRESPGAKHGSGGTETPIPVEIARSIAKGQIKPEEVWMFLDDDDSSTSSYETNSDFDSSSEDDDDDEYMQTDTGK